MKKILSILFCAIFASVLFVACDDEETYDGKSDAQPAKTVAGTYSGSWSLAIGTSSSTTETIVDGTVTLAAESNYVTTVTCVAGSTLNESVNANISYNGSEYSFANMTGSNSSIGTTFYGSIDDSGNITVVCDGSEKSGRTTTYWTYTFTGKK